jgi:hypothetical protein
MRHFFIYALRIDLGQMMRNGTFGVNARSAHQVQIATSSIEVPVALWPDGLG